MPNLISPEVTRLAQLKAKQAGVDINYELARSIVEESIIELDPELDLVINTSESFSDIAGLARVVGVNDIVVNERHIDIRILNDAGFVEISRTLTATPYLLNGSLIVSLQGTEGGAVVGYIDPASWMAAEQHAKEATVTLKFDVKPDFDLARALSEICSNPAQMSSAIKTLPNETELLAFINDRKSIIAARQKQIVMAILNDVAVRAKFEEAQAKVRNADRVVSDAGIWAGRVEKVVESVSPKFSALSQKEVRSVVRKTGEIFGGQPESPQFRKHMLNKLTVEQLSKKFAGVPLSKVAEVVDNVFSGQSAVDSVKSIINNKVAVDIAAKIKTQRSRADGFVAATADEIGKAFSQLSLQPAYATHSSADSGVESINEALQLLEAAELAEQASSILQ